MSEYQGGQGPSGAISKQTSTGPRDREDVWLALSDLFLDTDVTLRLDQIERVLLAAPFDLETLDRIFLDEVYPVCIHHLHMVAGHWAGFDENWLFGRIETRKEAWRPLGWLWRPLRQRHARRMVPEWFTLRDRLIARGMR